MEIHIFIARMGVGGAERVCVNLANEFAKKGHEVHIVVLNLENDVNTHLLDKKVQVHSLGVSRLRYSFIAMLKYVKKYRPPFFFVFGNEMAVILNKLRKAHLINTPLIVRVLNNVNISLSKEDNVSPIVENYLKNAQKQLADMDHVIAQCDAMQEMLLNMQLVKKEQVSVIYNPVSEYLLHNTVRKNNENPNKQIVFVGRVDPQKNLPHLVRAFAKVLEKRPDTQLRIIGDGHSKESLMKVIEELKITNKISMEGITSHIEEVYATADVIALSSEYEGMPNCLIEAIGIGIPIVSYDCPLGPSEIIEDGVNGYLVTYNDIDELAQKLVLALDRKWDTEAIKETCDKFRVEHVAKKYLQIFEKIVDRC